MINMTSVASSGLSVAEMQLTLLPLLLFVLGVVIYAVFIFKFYRFLARKDIFKFDIQQYNKTFLGSLKKFFGVILYVIKYLFIFPLFIFFWFAVISLILIMLSDKLDVSQILLISMALVSAIRMTAYYDEDLSKDLAKMFPFALLAVFLLDITVFSYETLMAQLHLVPGLWKQMVYYFVFIILLEFVLRILYAIVKQLFSEKENKE